MVAYHYNIGGWVIYNQFLSVLCRDRALPSPISAYIRRSRTAEIGTFNLTFPVSVGSDYWFDQDYVDQIYIDIYNILRHGTFEAEEVIPRATVFDSSVK